MFYVCVWSNFVRTSIQWWRSIVRLGVHWGEPVWVRHWSLLCDNAMDRLYLARWQVQRSAPEVNGLCRRVQRKRTLTKPPAALWTGEMDKSAARTSHTWRTTDQWFKTNFTAVRSDCGWSTIKIWQHEDWISLHQWSVMQRQIISNYSFSSLWLGAVNTASTPECCSWWKTGNGRVPGSMRDKLDFSHNMKIKYFGNIVEKGWKIQFQ